LKVDDVVIIETSPIERVKYCLVGLPDVGLVGAISVSYIVKSLNMLETGYLESDLLPPVMVVHNGDPKTPFRVYNKGDLTAITSEVPVNRNAVDPMARCIVDWIKSKNVELLISISGIAVQNRLEIEAPMVYGVGTSPHVRELFKKADVKTFEEGFIAGLHAVIAKECLKKNVPNAILLAQSHLQYPDPGAAVSSVNALNKLLDLKVDVKRLTDQAEEIRIKTRELMHRTQRSMQQMQKGQEQEMPMMYT